MLKFLRREDEKGLILSHDRESLFYIFTPCSSTHWIEVVSQDSLTFLTKNSCFLIEIILNSALNDLNISFILKTLHETWNNQMKQDLVCRDDDALYAETLILQSIHQFAGPLSRCIALEKANNTFLQCPLPFFFSFNTSFNQYSKLEYYLLTIFC